MITNPLGQAKADRCRRWARVLADGGSLVFIPEIADFEVRRELLRLGRTDGVARLDVLRQVFFFAAINSDVMLRAAELWASARRSGQPTAHAEALDADVILAAQALAATGQRDI